MYGCFVRLFEVTHGRKSEGKSTFCAFIDVKKAYDRVWRGGLMKRSWDVGVRGKMWRMLRALYSNVESCVIVDGESSEWFESQMGVRQGCILSPVLYSIFMNVFALELLRCGVGGVMVVGEWLRILLFADDIVLFAENAEQLQLMLDVLSEYCKKWRFEINVGKSKVMVCGPSYIRENDDVVWSLCGGVLERVRVYKYVGVGE